MWYKLASAQTAFNKLANALINTKIRKEYFRVKGVFPSRYEMQTLERRAHHLIATKYGSLWDLRKETMERKIQTLVNEALEKLKI